MVKTPIVLSWPQGMFTSSITLIPSNLSRKRSSAILKALTKVVFLSSDGRSTCSGSFSSTKGVQQALALEELPSGVVEQGKQESASTRGDEASEGEEAEGESIGGGEAPDDENR